MADYVVSTWDEFLQHNTYGDTVKFANPHEVNGEIVLEGNGAQNNPYIVSTYEEMLFATGATYIWKVKLIDREQKLYRYRYISDYDEQRNPIYSEIFCKYDDSLTTIDFNDIQPEGFSAALTFLANSVDFNGWTFENLIIKSELKFNNEVDNSYINGRFINMIVDTPNSFAIRVIRPSYTKNCVFDITSRMTGRHAVFNTIPSNSAITIHAADGSDCNLCYDSSYWIQNTIINLDISGAWTFGSVAFVSCLITGKCESTYIPTSFGRLATYAWDTVYNFETSNSWGEPEYITGVTALNSSKAPNVTSYNTKFKLVTDEVMRSAQDLADLGLPIVG